MNSSDSIKQSLSSLIRGTISFVSYLCFTVVIFTIFLLITPIKLLLPIQPVRKICNYLLNALGDAWVFCGNMTHKITGNVEWRIQGDDKINFKQWCLILVNHQSWVDILVLMKVFYHKVPPFKFFIKKELIWFPIIGLCVWALDFPFMKRYSKDFLKKNPHLKGKDMEATRKACEKYKKIPVSIFNFVEGTRFTKLKHDKQKSPYEYLLKPKAGGTAFVLYAMGDFLKQIVNVTIVYPDGIPGLWDFFCGRVKKILVDVKIINIRKDLIGNYFTNENFKLRFQEWLNQLWSDKDAVIETLLADGSKIQSSS